MTQEQQQMDTIYKHWKMLAALCLFSISWGTFSQRMATSDEKDKAHDQAIQQQRTDIRSVILAQRDLNGELRLTNQQVEQLVEELRQMNNRSAESQSEIRKLIEMLMAVQ